MDKNDKPVNRRRFLCTGAASVVSLGLVTAAEASINPESKKSTVSNASMEPVAHGDLSGLDRDDHLQYFTETRGDLRYPRREEFAAGLDAKVDESQKDLPNGFVGLDADGKIALERFTDLDSPQNGNSLVLREGAIVNVVNTYRRLDTEFGVVADDVVENSARIQTAFNAIRDGGGGTLVFPNGITKISGSTSLNLIANRGAVRIIGSGGDTAIHIAGGTSIFYFHNLPQINIEGLTFIGTNGNSVFDCSRNVIWFNEVERATVRDCRFLGLSIYAPEDMTFALNKRHGIVVGERTDLMIDTCLFGGNATRNCPNVGVTDWYGVTVRDSQFIDYGLFRGVNYVKVGDFPNWYWFRAIGAATSALAVCRNKAVVKRSSFDEAIGTAIYIDNARSVELDNVCSNIGNADWANIFVKNVRHCTVRDSYVGTANYAGTLGMDAMDCGVVEMDNTVFAGDVRYVQLSGNTRKFVARYCTLPGGEHAENGILNRADAEVSVDSI